MFPTCPPLGVPEGAGEAAAAGHVAQGRDEEDPLPAALVQSSPGEEELPGHEAGRRGDPGRLRGHWCNV